MVSSVGMLLVIMSQVQIEIIFSCLCVSMIIINKIISLLFHSGTIPN